MRKVVSFARNYHFHLYCLFLLIMLLSACGSTPAAKQTSQPASGTSSTRYQEDGFSISKGWSLTNIPAESLASYMPAGMQPEQVLVVSDKGMIKSPPDNLPPSPLLQILVFSNPHHITTNQVIKAIQALTEMGGQSFTIDKKQASVGKQKWDQYTFVPTSASSTSTSDGIPQVQTRYRLITNYSPDSAQTKCYLIDVFVTQGELEAEAQSALNSFQFD